MLRANSLAFRLFVVSALWTLIVLPIAGFLIFRLYKDDFQTSFDVQLKKLVIALTIDSMSEATDRPVAPTNRYEPLFEVTLSGWYWQIKPLDGPLDKTLVSASLASSTLPSPFERKFPSDATGTRWVNVVGPNGDKIRIVEVIDTLGHEPGTPRYSIIVAGPMDWFEASVSSFTTRLATALSLAGLGLVLATLFQIQFALRPLREIEKSLGRIRSAEAERLEGQLPVEIEPLQRELNALLQSNQDIIERARTQVGNLAHGLKTPLAVIVNEARDAKTPFAKKVAMQAGVMRDQINHYLDRARVAARVNVIGGVTEVRPVVDPLVRALGKIHQDTGIDIKVECPAGLKFRGDRQDLEEVLGNVLDNACKWADRRVRLTIEPADPDNLSLRDGEAGLFRVVVEDDGPGLSAEQRAKLGKRGLRLDETKPGSGLGLSIVTDLVGLYRGTFGLEASKMGGLKAVITLPLG
ncbi:MAG: sensor histidine kinase [Pseudomonadota bacterium]